MKKIKRTMAAVLSVLLIFPCTAMAAVSSNTDIPAGTPTEEVLLEQGELYLEAISPEYFAMNPDAENDIIGENTESSENTDDAEVSDNEEYVEDTEAESELVYTTEFEPTSYIMVGDSRFVGMHEAVGDAGCTWICELSTELSWFTNTAVPQIDAAVTDGAAIVINMGVNDLGDAMGYVSVLWQKVPEWVAKGAVVYYMSVNPIQRHAFISNNSIVDFNNTVFENMPDEMGWIETNAYLLANGYSTIDGLHFDAGTYQNIFIYCMEHM